MKVLNIFFISFIAAALFMGSCNEPSLIGSELVEDEQGVLQFVDTFSLKVENVKRDSLIAYSPNFANYSNYLFGDLDDPIFGSSKSELYFRIGGPGFYPDYDEALRYDSAVLVIPLDSINTYGDLSVPFEYELFELTEQMAVDVDYYTDTTFSSEPMPLLTGSFVPNLIDSMFIKEPNSDNKEEDVKVGRQLRIRLPDAFAERLYTTDSLSYESDSIFAETFKGFYLKPVNKTKAMASLRLWNSGAGIRLYYHSADTVFRQFPYSIDRVIVPSYEQDLAGAPGEDIVDNPDSLFILQAMKGYDARVELPDLSSLGDIIINKAELEFTVESLAGDDIDIYRPIDQIVLTYQLDDGSLRTVIDDIVSVSLDNPFFEDLFGGNISTVGNKQFYRFSISSHLQDVYSGAIEKDLYLEPFQRAQKASRVVLKGPGAKINSPKLKIYYTESTN